MAGKKGINLKHGMSHTRPWVIWTDMKRRCKNSDREGFKFYGAKGITYQDSWEKFENFWEDMKEGYKEGLTLERINPSENYCKENCEWVCSEQQAKNKKIYKNNTTGVGGTYFASNKGIESIVAHISDSGKRYKRTFSLKKYSLEEALALAKLWRDAMKEKFDYSEFHGECDQ